MTDEIDDNEFFQQDFTTASEWEIFTARLEELFHEWRLPYVEIGRPLPKNELSLCAWNVTTESVFFADVELNITRYCAKLQSEDGDQKLEQSAESSQTCQAFCDLISLANDYCILDEKSDNSIHPLARWYGLRDFVIVSPKKSITNESQIRILLSSIHIAAFESNTEIPVFVQALEKKQDVYSGICDNRSTRLSFDIVHLSTTPPTCKYLSGLLDMFKGKIGIQYVDPVTVTVQLTYSLNKFVNTSFVTKRKYAFSDHEDEQLNNTSMNVLPFGVSLDPVTEILLFCSWPHVAENVVIDSQNYSDFDPLLAPKWSIRSRFEETPICFMSECISEYLQLCEQKKTLSELLGDSYMYSGQLNLEGNPLDLLTESKISSLTSVLPNFPSKSSEPKKSSKCEGPINEEQLMQMLYYMFPDAHSESQQPYVTEEKDKIDQFKIKTALPDSLVHRLSSLLALCNTYFGGIKAMAQLWAEFTQEMRYRVERCVQIPGVANGFPDSRTCLLHQKLQMLNICMERRSIREGGLPFAMTGKKGKYSNQEDSEDEFFDCANEEEEDRERNKIKHAPWNKPEGRLSRLSNMQLVNSDEPLYIPITQEPVPKTEDQLEDDAEVMLKLGPGSELRAQMMSASLLSDMESFKAANPNGKLEDFIRWYSPRDWIENENEDNGTNKPKGRLSSRMLIPGNTWQVVWEAAKLVPAKRQKRLFDDTKEAEKVMHYLESRNIGQIVQMTLPTLCHSSTLQIREHMTNETSVIPNCDEKLIASCSKISRETWIFNATHSKGISIKTWENFIQDITNMEYLVIKSQSLIKKLFQNTTKLSDEDKNIVLSLLNGYDAEILDGALGGLSVRILNLFREAKYSQNEQYMDEEQNVQFTLPNPVEKQYTMRLCGKTVSKGVGGVQFLRAILGQNEFRLCGAFSQDATFY